MKVGISFSGWVLQKKNKNSDDINICGRMAQVIKKMISNDKEKYFFF